MHRSPPISRDSSNSYRKKRAKHVTPDDTDSNNYDQRSGSNHSIKKAPSHDKSHSDDHSEERRLTTSHRGSLDKPSKVGGGQDKRHDKATAVSKSGTYSLLLFSSAHSTQPVATAPRREEPLQAGSKRKKVCEVSLLMGTLPLVLISCTTPGYLVGKRVRRRSQPHTRPEAPPQAQI